MTTQIKKNRTLNWEKRFDKKFPSWLNRKFNLKTGEVEYKKDFKGKGRIVITEREKLKSFIRQLI